MVDPIMSDHLTSLMLRLKKELRLTSVVVTHDLDLLHNVADNVVFLNKGRIAYFGPTDGLYKSDNPDIQEFLELDKVIRGASLRDTDPFRSGLGGIAPEA
jgi:phospholipid/cholesterol/gamma-HCH transport system ATP-binding protein